MYPIVTVVGSIVRESIDMRFSQGGKAFCRFRMKISQRKKEGNDWVDGEAIWQSVVCFDKRSEHFADTFNDGDTVIVLGRLEPNIWKDKDGQEHRDLNLVAEEIGASIQWNAWESKATERKSPAQSDDPWTSNTTTQNDEPPF
jgi:single-strand DNA-binding protein